MAVTPLDVEQARMDAAQEKNQRRMEKGIVGKAQTLPNKNPKKNWADEMQTLPNKNPKKITTLKDLEDMTKYRKGGYVSAADGCAKKGKTKGRIL